MATKTRRLADLLANIDDDSKVTSAGLLDATITAADLAPNSVDSDELVNGAVDTSHIANDAVDADKLASNAVVAASIVDNAVTGAKIAADTIPVKPHIQPGTLYPAWSGLLEDNTGFTFTDSSASAHVIAATKNAHHSGGIKKIGSTSIKLNQGQANSGADHLYFGANNADFDFGSGDFTIEFWFNVREFNPGGTGDQTWVGPTSVQWGTSNGFHCLTIGATPKAKFGTVLNASAVALTGTTTIVKDTWYHYAAVRVGTSLKLYLNGAQEATATISGAHGAGNGHANRPVTIGSRQNHATNFTFDQFSDVSVDDVRIVKGLGVYTGAFTAPTTALTTTWSAGTNIAANSTASNVKFLLHSDNGGHSGAYGTAQSDGKKYYYTDIKGSKPIKDPRIGAHFGSQRHLGKSIQLLEQETATHGKNVHSVDGREWMRIVGNAGQILNNTHGTRPQLDMLSTDFIEIVGYFNRATWSSYTNTHGTRYFTSTVVNGGSAHTTDTSHVTTVSTPLAARYVDAGSVVKVEMETIASPQITTLRLNPASSGYIELYAIELIAQDTGSATRKNHVNIPAQNVVSYGKKFSIGSDTLTNAVHKHYNPFAFKTDGTTAWASGAHNGTGWPAGANSAHNIDTATSLGLSNWLHSSNYYKPYNGGRVVVWVASDGTIKTSVNVMPPNAKCWNNADISKKANASIANNITFPTFESGETDSSQAEVAKTFFFREFGNGSANGGTGATYADASMVAATSDVIAYVMDDGLTALSCATASCDTTGWHRTDLSLYDTNNIAYLTFIGTGISLKDQTANGTWKIETIAQNLPYGTHIVKLVRDGSTNGDHSVDGVACATDFMPGSYGGFSDVTFHQPKMPPIPEDACIIADYMLMADFVAQPADATFNHGDISKGVRYLSATRDVKYDQTSNITSNAGWAANVAFDAGYPQGFMLGGRGTAISAGSANLEIPYFGTDVSMTGYTGRMGSTWTESINSTSISNTVRNNSRESRVNTTGQTLQLNGFKATWTSAEMFIASFEIASPIHTSSHYQTFESEFLHELVGGDRNMEQNNLVVTADGKTWDEVTRDTSYMGPSTMMQAWRNGGNVAQNVYYVWNMTRGISSSGRNIWARQKNIAIGNDQIWILEDGTYNLYYLNHMHATGNFVLYVYINDTIAGFSHNSATGSIPHNEININVVLKRGDYLTSRTTTGGAQLHGLGPDENMLVVTKLD